jgi:hypothetical protein
MLGTLLEKLGTLLPKNFIVAYFFPMLLFASTNALMLYWTSEKFRGWCERYYALDAGKQALSGLPLLIAVALIAYIFSTLSLFLREMLEGKYLDYFPRRIKASLMSAQQRKLSECDAQLRAHRRRRRELNRLAPCWINTLRDARVAGNRKDAVCSYSSLDPASISIETLLWKRKRYEPIAIEELSAAVDLLAPELERFPVDQRDPHLPDIANKELLADDQDTLYMIVQELGREADNEYVASFNEREFNYSSYKIAPTAMGNIAESVRGYARSRYSINLDPFWSRLEKIVQADEKFYAALLDIKTQLDFLISLLWLTVIFTALWFSVLLWTRRSLLAFLMVVGFGPWLSWVWYKIALQNYRAFADILRTSVDLYRLELLAALHIRLPAGTEHERRMWTELNQLIGYGDDEVRISYKHSQL